MAFLALFWILLAGFVVTNGARSGGMFFRVFGYDGVWDLI